jgi:hypothetical protein
MLAGCGINELISQVKRYSLNIFLVRKLILTKKIQGGCLVEKKQKYSLLLFKLKKKQTKKAKIFSFLSCSFTLLFCL